MTASPGGIFSPATRPTAPARLSVSATFGGDDVSDVLFTSGTTGPPKGVMTTHAQNLRAYYDWSTLAGLREGDRYAIVNPFFHAFGYKAGWLSGFMHGATIYPHATFDVPRLLDQVEAERITVLPGPPTLYHSPLAPALAPATTSPRCGSRSPAPPSIPAALVRPDARTSSASTPSPPPTG